MQTFTKKCESIFLKDKQLNGSWSSKEKWKMEDDLIGGKFLLSSFVAKVWKKSFQKDIHNTVV